MPVARPLSEQSLIREVAAALRRWACSGRRPAWLLLSHLIGRALSFPLTLGIARLGGPSLLGQASIALAFYATACVVTTVGLTHLATLEGGKERPVSIWSIRRAAYVQLVCCGPFLAILGIKLDLDVLVVALMLMAVAIDLDSRCLTAFARGHFRPRYELIAAALNGGIPLLGLLLLHLSVGLTLEGIAACFLAGSVAMRLYVAIDVPTGWPDMLQNRERVTTVLRVGAVLSGLSMIVAVQYRLDQFILGTRWNPALFGVYSAGARLLDVAYALPGSICAFWAIHLQRQMNFGTRRLIALSLVCAFGSATLFLALTMLLPLFGRDFLVLAEHWPLFTTYAALMGFAVAIMTTAVAIGRASIPTAAMLVSVLARFVLLSHVAPRRSYLSVLVVLCVTECLTIGVIILGLYLQRTPGERQGASTRRG